MNLTDYIQSGIVESYTMGLASEAQRIEFESKFEAHPEVRVALKAFEDHLERFTLEQERPAPPEVRARILEHISDPDWPFPEQVYPAPLRNRKWGWRRRNSPVVGLIVIHDDRVMILRSVLQQPDTMDRLNSRQFEQLVADLFIKLGYRATLTAATRDGGKDILVVRDTEVGELAFVVECKHWFSGNKVGEAVLRDLYGVTEYHRATMGILVTSGYFSSDAKRFQGRLKNRLTLIDRTGLLKWIAIINGESRRSGWMGG